MSHVKTMEPPRAPVAAWIPGTEEERAAIREQLERVLSTPYFKNSKRYPCLLRFVTERALNGQAGHIKERTLGVAVFGKDPQYDTNQDPVVRITAAEIRKRLAQYYHEPGHEPEIRIDFPAGSYVPEFQKPQTSTEPLEITKPATKPKPYFLAAVVTVFAIAASSLAVWPATKAIDRFWAPVWESPNPTLICIGGFYPNIAAGTPPDATLAPSPMTIGQLQKQEIVAFADAVALAGISGLFSSREKSFHIRSHRSADLEDLRYGPVVLIGAFNNSWTMRLAEQQRFSFERNGSTLWIRDRRNPQLKNWMVHVETPYTSALEDYALVSRVLDPTTKRTLVIVAGLTKFGTQAAGEFVTDPAYMQAVAQDAPPLWYRKNIQIVIATRVVGVNSGSPRVVATHYW